MTFFGTPQAKTNQSGPLQVMIVEDSRTMRRLFSSIINSEPGMHVIAEAETAEIAINLLRRTGEDKITPEIITLDIELGTGKNGLEAIPSLLELAPDVKILMASSLTLEGAEETMQALSLGAADFLAKPSAATQEPDAMYQFTRKLIEKIRDLGRAKRDGANASTAMPPVAKAVAAEQEAGAKQNKPIILRERTPTKPPLALAIGCSTGGPNALTQLFEAFKGKKFNVPVFITQHMPKDFTAMLAKQIANISGLHVTEAVDGEKVENGHIYLAPGDYHMLLKQNGGTPCIHLTQDPPENFCRPAVDPMLRSLEAVYGKDILVAILTGMGADGLKGCQKIVESGGTIIAQDEQSSVVWGMPGAVARAGICSEVLPLRDIAPCLERMAMGKIS